jgi:hypothetical protein
VEVDSLDDCHCLAKQIQKDSRNKNELYQTYHNQVVNHLLKVVDHVLWCNNLKMNEIIKWKWEKNSYRNDNLHWKSIVVMEEDQDLNASVLSI